MNLNNIYKGQIIKNYKELCKLLEIPNTGGNTKKKYLKELKRHIKYHHEGYKFIIDEIYDKPKSKIDNRGGAYNTVEYIDSIEKLLLDLLVQSKDNCISLSKNQLLRAD